MTKRPMVHTATPALGKGWKVQVLVDDEWRTVNGVDPWWIDPDTRLLYQVRDEEYNRMIASVPQRNYVADYREATAPETYWDHYLRKAYEADMKVFLRHVDERLAAWQAAS